MTPMLLRKFPLTGRMAGALASPLRQDLLMVLENSAPLSAAELARRIGRRPDSLYHHLRLLASLGIVREERRPSTGGRPGSAWRLTRKHVHAAPARDGTTRLADVERVVGTMARSALRDFGRALRRSLPGGRSRPTGTRACGWLTEREREQFQRSLQKLISQLRGHAPRQDRSPYVLTTLFSSAPGAPPEPARKGRPRRRGARSPR